MQNMRANALARLASALDSGGALAHEFLMAPIVPTHDITGTEVSPSWMEEILCFKKDEKELDDPATARQLRRTQAWYCVVGGKLYHRAFSQPLLRCLAPSEAKTVLAELHEGICGEHIAGRTLAFKTLRQGYY